MRSTSEATILVHGLWWGRVSMLPLARRLEQGDKTILRFGYPTVRRQLDRNAVRLAEFAAGIDADRLNLVGHSLGGLVILHMLVGNHKPLPPGRVVLMGSPVNGSSVARRLAQMRLLRALMGRASETLEHGVGTVSVDRSIGVIAGTSMAGAGRVISRLDRPHDGTVAVSETRLEGASDQIELAVSHTGMLFSRLVADQVAVFLAGGAFDHDRSG